VAGFTSTIAGLALALAAGNASAFIINQATDAECIADSRDFQFRIDRAAFERALQYARNIDPALSGDAASYHLAQFRFQNEIFQEAELGATVERVELDVFF